MNKRKRELNKEFSYMKIHSLLYFFSYIDYLFIYNIISNQLMKKRTSNQNLEIQNKIIGLKYLKDNSSNDII